MSQNTIIVIGGGLAGSEAAWQAAHLGCKVTLHEMKPAKYSEAHSSDGLAELVCSNSFRSNAPDSAVGLLKTEMRRFNSLIMEAADTCQVPAGKALAVDRLQFSHFITEKISNHPHITVTHGEVTSLPEASTIHPVIIATGPLTSAALTKALVAVTGQEHLAFYDAIAPIVTEESLDRQIIYQASRYDDGPGDYLNCPMNKEEYLLFIDAVKKAQKVPLKSFEKEKYFEGCLPIEVMLERGDDTLRFGPMKPVGLPDPRTGRDPWAVVQLRKENRQGTTYNMVGFQTKLTYPEQKRVFRMIPGMQDVEFVRLGSIHRNTFVCAPEVLTPTLEFKNRPGLFLAGQLSGVEGYVESTAMGILAGQNAARQLSGDPLLVPPEETALGALIRHLTETEMKHFQPSNINFGLFPPLHKKLPKKLRGHYRAEQADIAFSHWLQKEGIAL